MVKIDRLGGREMIENVTGKMQEPGKFLSHLKKTFRR